MRSQTKIGLFLAVAAISCATSFAARAEGEKVGDTQMCIESNRIKNTQVLDNKTVLISMDTARDNFKRIDLARTCGLTGGRTFSYSTSLPKLRKQDVLTVIETGEACVIDQIVTIDSAEAKSLQAAKKR